jgi:hypothetical protein
MSYFWTAIVSAVRVATTRSSDARRFAVPLAAGSSGFVGEKLEESATDRLLGRRQRGGEACARSAHHRVARRVR